jgi:ABC-type iron transport system FetAB permease component
MAMEQLFIQAAKPNEDEPELTWANVGIALSFILVDGTPAQPVILTKVIFSVTLGLGIEKSILIASARCLIQLTLMVLPN